MEDQALWTRRYSATQIGFPSWSERAPGKVALVSNRSGSWQGWSHDLETGAWRQATQEPVGVEHVEILPDGRLCWWHDDSGDERGRAVTTPFDGGEPTDLVPGIPDGWAMGLSVRDGRVALGVEVDGEYRVYVTDAGAEPKLVYTSLTGAGVGSTWGAQESGLSADGSLLCFSHTEHGDILHEALRVVDATTGAALGDLLDAGQNLSPVAWSPVPGDQRLALTSELGTFERPAIWDLRTGVRKDLDVDLPGAVFPVGWYPDARSLLVRHEHEGRAQLYRLALDTGRVELLIDPGGDIESSALRPDGRAWLRVSDGVRPPRIVDDSGEVAVANPDEDPPLGAPLRDLWATNPHGQRIHAFVVTPTGDGPFPTVMSIHGGPEWHERDRYDAETQAFVDNGYAVALVNYRGSTGYGIAFRRALIGNVCFTESEDILAVYDELIDQAIAKQGHVFWAGWSWGGCLACFNAGMHPDRWRAIVAGIPAGDFVAAHWASAPELQAWDDAVYQGNPDTNPEAYARSNPMTYASKVTAPVLVIAGLEDPRCPIEGVTPWVEAVQANGGTVEVHTYATGHHANQVDEQVQHMQLMLDFFDRYR